MFSRSHTGKLPELCWADLLGQARVTIHSRFAPPLFRDLYTAVPNSDHGPILGRDSRLGGNHIIRLLDIDLRSEWDIRTDL